MKSMSLAHGVLALVVIPLAPAPALAHEPPGAKAPGANERLVLKPLGIALADGTKHEGVEGRLVVPESRARPQGRTLELAFVRVKSKAEKPGPPAFFLQGGPGQAATPIARDPRALADWTELLALGDLVFLDPRGVGASTPSLFFAADPKRELPREFFADLDLARRLILQSQQECRAHFEAQGIDLAAYDTEECADDVADVAAALGLERVNLVAFSYGTLLAQSVLRRHGGRVERAILVGTEGPCDWGSLPSTLQAQVGKLSWLASRDENVNHAVPDLQALLARVLEKLEASPLEVPITDRRSGKRVPLLLGRWGLEFLIRIDAGDGNDFPLFPALLWTVDQGRTDLVGPLLEKRYHQVLGGGSAMAQAVRYAYGPTPAFEKALEAEHGLGAFEHMVNYFDLDNRAVWNVPLHDAGFRAPLVTAVPTLFLSGTLDSNSPPWQAERVRSGFLNASHLVVEHAGHEDLLSDPQVRATMSRFLRGEDVSTESLRLPLPRFVPIQRDAK